VWILPKNYQLSSAFAQDMVASKEDLTLQGLNIESSLMWRSKRTPLQTWLQRWNRVLWLQHLFTRILKPSHQKSFETKLALSLEVIPASLLAQQDSEKAQMTQDTCGLTLGDTLNQLDLFGASLKMSKGISRLDSEKSLATWKKMVTEQRGEYLERKSLGLFTKENESISLPTPTCSSAEGGRQKVEYLGTFKTYRSNSNQWYGAKLRSVLEINQPKDSLANPAFVEEMMGLKTGLTDIGSWGTE